ncbi:MAG: AAA family ATPase [Rhodobacteraceae bacterium]|nr:AAA family ATPase [Paracoccaceae bacterium]
MLFRVEIENFYSFGTQQEIDLRVPKSVRDGLGRLSPTFSGSSYRAPNVVALLGPNAAGKSTVLRAIAFAAWFATESFGHRFNRPLPYMKFGSVARNAEPTRLSFSFSGPADFQDMSNEGPTCPYTYELVLSPRGTEPDSVIREKLSYQPGGSGKPTTIVERLGSKQFRSARFFMTVHQDRALKEVLRSNASAICTLAQLNHEISATFVKWISCNATNMSIDRTENDEGGAVQWYASNIDAFSQLQRIVKRIDLGIEQIELDVSSSKPQLRFHHPGLDCGLPLELESHGTRQLIKLLPLIQSALKTGGVAVIDDMDSVVHPMLLPEIMRWFGDEELNPRGAQLWTTCHATSLLMELTMDEVMFCSKNSNGQSTVFKLADVKGVRRTKNLFGKYMGGEYGAVPTIG